MIITTVYVTLYRIDGRPRVTAELGAEHTRRLVVRGPVIDQHLIIVVKTAGVVSSMRYLVLRGPVQPEVRGHAGLRPRRLR